MLLSLLGMAAARADEAFDPLYRVLSHPRCSNCHADGDRPLQRDFKPHNPAVQRGPEGAGSGSLVCANCHKDRNLPAVPGAPSWKMPAPARPMIFRGRAPGALCRQITDPTQNGGLDTEGLGRHLTEDPLIAWAWNAGAGRPPPPMPRDAFNAAAAAWLRSGAPCPAD